MENVGKYRNCATFILLTILVVVKSGFLHSGCCPSYVESSLFRFSIDLDGLGRDFEVEMWVSLVGFSGDEHF